MHMRWSLPFFREIDWPRLVVEVSEEHFWQGRLAPQCLGLSHKEQVEKHDYIAEVRGLLRYDLAGGSRDAFSLLMDGVRRALTDADGGSTSTPHLAQVCSATPRGARHVETYLEETRTVEKRWSHAFSEVSCCDPSLWQPAGAFFKVGADPQVLFEQYTLTASWCTADRMQCVRVYGRTEKRLDDLRDQRRVLQEAKFALCFPDVPVACHDSLIPVEGELVTELCSEVASPRPAMPSCRLLAEVAPVPPLLALGAQVHVELVLLKCRPGSGRMWGTGAMEMAGLVIHTAVYDTCEGRDGPSSNRLLLEHTLVRLHQAHHGGSIPDFLLLAWGPEGAEETEETDAFLDVEVILERFLGQLRRRDAVDWVFVVEGPPGRSWPCEGDKFMSQGCETEVVPRLGGSM